MSFSLEQLEPLIAHWRKAPAIWVAYSGGCDSHVLLHALAALRDKQGYILKAVHINHGLSPLADAWEDHCQQICQQLAVPYTAIAVNARQKDQSLEAAARHARYAAWRKLLQHDEVLALAHHQDDQAETVLLQLFRGSGVKGLAAMPAEQSFAAGRLCRPLLGFSREELLAYAELHGLHWIDDPSNFDTDLDRNFLRHDVMPLLQNRWPALKRVLARTASHQAEAAQLLDELAFRDWHRIHDHDRITIAALRQLTAARQRNVLRYWLAEVCELPLPDTVHLHRIMHEVLPAAEDASPEVIWPGAEVRRYQGQLYAMAPARVECAGQVMPWPDPAQHLLLPDGRRLTLRTVSGQGISPASLAGADVEIRFRQGGEQCRPVGRGQRHALKKLLQEWQVPPWLRSRVPLLYINDELACVVGHCVCEPFQAQADEAGQVIELV